MTTGPDFERGISNIKDAIGNNGDNAASLIEDQISELRDLDSSQIGDLLNTLSDEFPFQEAMWSIMHHAESFLPPVYIDGFARSLSFLDISAPGWAETLLMRIMNSEEYTKELTNVLRGSSELTKRSFVNTTNRIEEEYSGRFTSRIDRIRLGTGA